MFKIQANKQTENEFWKRYFMKLSVVPAKALKILKILPKILLSRDDAHLKLCWLGSVTKVLLPEVGLKISALKDTQ